VRVELTPAAKVLAAHEFDQGVRDTPPRERQIVVTGDEGPRFTRPIVFDTFGDQLDRHVHEHLGPTPEPIHALLPLHRLEHGANHPGTRTLVDGAEFVGLIVDLENVP
jgi:hypothetical protein